MPGKTEQIESVAGSAPRSDGIDGRTRYAKRFKRLVAEWTKALPPAPLGSGIRADLVRRGAALAIKVAELEADILAGRAIETGTYQKLVATLIGIQRTLGLIPNEARTSLPKAKPKNKPGPKPSTLSTHAKAVKAACE